MTLCIYASSGPFGNLLVVRSWAEVKDMMAGSSKTNGSLLLTENTNAFR